MKISKTDLVKLIVEANNQGYNEAVAQADRNYDEFSADFREAIKRAQDETEEVKRAMPEALASAKSQAYEAGRREAFSDEALANAKSQAYEMGHARGLEEGQARGSGKALSDARILELMAEARESERQKIEAAEPKLSVRFMPPGKPQFEMVCGAPVLKPRGYEPNKIEGIRAIREAYDGLGLKEAKDLVETEAEGLIPCGEALPQSKAVALYLRLYDLGYQVELRKP